MKKEVIVHHSPKSPVSEIFRTLRTNIQFMNNKKKMKTVLLTSTMPGEGKSYVSANLAATFAQAGEKTLLIDADMRKGIQYQILGGYSKPGLSNYLSGIHNFKGEEIDNCIQDTEIENLYFLPAGSVPPNPSELLITPKMIDMLNELREEYDIIIIDGTPTELVTDSLILSRIVDTTVIIAEYKKTKKENLKQMIKNIQNVGGDIAGVVINKVNVSANRYQDTYYYYGKRDSKNKKKRKKI